MGILKSLAAGLGSVLRNPSLLLWLYAANLVVALPLAYTMRAILTDSIGASLTADQLTTGFDTGWHGEFEFTAKGLAKTFGPGVTGSLPILANLEALLDGKLLQTEAVIAAAGCVFLLLWVFLSAGVLDRYAFPEETHSRARFFGRCGEYFWRFLRLLFVALAMYGAIAWVVGRPLHRWITSIMRDVTTERTVMLYTLGAYLVVGFLMILTAVILDYTKIAIVAEKRRSVLFALFRGIWFVLSNPLRTLGLYFVLLVVSFLGLVAYAWVAPGATQAQWITLLLAFGLSQVFILARIAMKLWFLASQMSLFQTGRATLEEPPSETEPVPQTNA